MDLLKRSLAPIPSEAWDQIDNEAKRVLKLNLAGRHLVDFDGPHGWQHAAVNLGRVTALSKEPLPGVRASMRVVQPLVELRTPFTLEISELDSVARGASDLTLDPVVDAAEKIALAEDSAIFNGYKDAGITGIIGASPHKPLVLPVQSAKYPEAVADAREMLRESGISGPYGLALGSKPYKELSQAAEDGYPIRKRIDSLVDAVVWAPAVQGAVLVSTRGGDFVVTVGVDLCIGYSSHGKDRVELYLTESLTFRVLEAAAAIYLKPGK